MTEYIPGTRIPKFSERGITILILRRSAPEQTLEALQRSGVLEVRWTPDGNQRAIYRKSDSFCCSNPMGSDEEAWESAVRIMRGEPGYYQAPYYCQKEGKKLWEEWEHLHQTL